MDNQYLLQLKELESLQVDELQSNFFYKIINSLPIPVIVIDLNYRILLANSAANSFNQGGPQSTCYQMIHNLEKPCQGSASPCPLEYVKKSGKSVVMQKYHASANGKTLLLEICAIPVLNRQGELVQIMEIIFDKSKNQSEIEILQRYQLLSENARDIILIINLDGSIIEANKAAINSYGYQREELLGKSIYDLRAPETQSIVDMQMRTADTTGLLFTTEHRRKDGTTFPVEVNSQSVVIGNKRVLMSIIRDITERRQAEEELRNAHQQVKDIIDFLPDPTFVIDRGKKVIAWNRAMESLTRVPKEKILGQGEFAYAIPFYGEPRPALIDFLWSDDKHINNRYNNVSRSGNTLYAETYISNLYGGRGGYLWLKASPLYDRGGNTVGAVQTIRDVTKYKLSEKALAWEAEVNAALAQLSKALVTSVTIDSIANMVLDNGKRITGSSYGFVAYFEPQTGKLISPTMTTDIWEQCSVSAKDTVFEKYSGLWGWVLQNKQPLVTNEPEKDYRSKGVPKGHIPIKNFLSAPAMLGNKLVGIISLANSKRDYTNQDKEFIERLASLYAVAINRKWEEEKLRQSREFNLAVLNSLTAHICVLNKDGKIVACNEAWKQFGRKNGASLNIIKGVGVDYLDVCRQGATNGCMTSKATLEGIQNVLDGSHEQFTQEYTCHSPWLKQWFLLHVTPLAGELGGAVVSHINITDRKKNEERQDAELSILSELTNLKKLRSALHNVLKILIKVTGCSAAAVRLADGEDFTYFTQEGFSDGFVARENSLCSLNHKGSMKRDSSGKVELECLCGKVLQENLQGLINDQYLTPYGSFITGSTSRMKGDKKGPLQLKGSWRLTCYYAGFETVVLVPIKDEGQNIGILQINGIHQDLITREDMPFLELVSRHIASAVKHLKDAEALEESEKRYRRLAENAPDAIYRINLVPKKRFEYISPVIKQMTGFTPQEHYDDPELGFKLVHPEDRGKLTNFIQGQEEAPKPFELRWINKDGKIIWTELRNLLIKDKNGRVVAVEGIARDITERRKIEDTQKRRMLYDRTMTEAMLIFTGIHKRHDVLVKLMDLLAERLGYETCAFYTYDEWKSFFEIYVSRSVNKSLVCRVYSLKNSVLTEAVLNRKVILVEKQLVLPPSLNKLGDTFDTVATAILPIYYQDKVQGVLLLGMEKKTASEEVEFLEQLAVQLGIALYGIKQFEDLKTLSLQLSIRQKEIERTNQELEQANQAKSEFLTNMSHELRTPLNSVIGFSELLEKEIFGQLNERQLEYVCDIKESGEHLLALINDILDLSKIEAGAMELDLHDVNLPDLLESSLRMFREKAMKNNIKLNIEIDEQVGLITADSRKIKQVVFNLLSNAFKFTHEGGQVILSAISDSQNVVVSVTDTGIGISDADKEKIFQEFSQVDGSLSRRHEGTGLGLALTKKLIEMHGGRIELESMLGKGSIFRFILPIKNDLYILTPARQAFTIDHPQRRTAKASRGKGSSILIIDDDPRAVGIIEDNLQDQGYRIVKAYSGAEGIRLVQEDKVDLIILDLMIPEIDGFEVIETLKQDNIFKNIPIIILTAKILTAADYKRLHGIVDRIMEKGSFSRDSFLSEISQLIQPSPGEGELVE